MKEIIIRKQKDLDSVSVKDDVVVVIKETTETIYINKKYINRVVARGNSSVEAMDNSSVEAWDNSSVVARGNSSVEAWGNSSVEARGNSSVVARGNSSVEAWGNSSVEAMDNSGIHLYSDCATITLFFLSVCWVKANGKVTKKSKKATIIKVPIFKPNIECYKEKYPVEITNNKAIFFKAVHKINDKYIADYDKETEYKVGEIKEIKNDIQNKETCSYGIHIAHKSWARNFGACWSDCALLEVETDIKDIVVCEDCDGKVRTSKIKVLREVPRDEWFKFNN